MDCGAVDVLGDVVMMIMMMIMMMMIFLFLIGLRLPLASQIA